jgi:hypothetical protein
MKDVTGKELTVGNNCVLIPQNGYTMSLSMGVIVGFTEKKVRIRLTNKCWAYSADECLKFPEQVAKVNI